MGLGNWSVKLFITKLLKRFVQISIAWAVGHNLDRFGVSIDPVQSSAALWALLETLRSLAKQKFKVTWL